MSSNKFKHSNDMFDHFDILRDLQSKFMKWNEFGSEPEEFVEEIKKALEDALTTTNSWLEEFKEELWSLLCIRSRISMNP